MTSHRSRLSRAFQTRNHPIRRIQHFCAYHVRGSHRESASQRRGTPCMQAQSNDRQRQRSLALGSACRSLLRGSTWPTGVFCVCVCFVCVCALLPYRDGMRGLRVQVLRLPAHVQCDGVPNFRPPRHSGVTPLLQCSSGRAGCIGGVVRVAPVTALRWAPSGGSKRALWHAKKSTWNPALARENLTIPHRNTAQRFAPSRWTIAKDSVMPRA